MPRKILRPICALRRRRSSAEAAHHDNPGSKEEANLAYLASRKAEIAMAQGKAAAAKHREDEAQDRYQETLRNTTQTEGETAQNERDSRNAAQQQLAVEADARRRAQDNDRMALSKLADVAKVSTQARGTVVTLPGNVLFPSGGALLSPSAATQKVLERVSRAIADQPATESRITIEGHTDARESQNVGQQLSMQRAEAVRDYMVKHGVDAQRLEPIGKGADDPIASNETAEGRATNRRVEIVVPSADATTQRSLSK